MSGCRDAIPDGMVPLTGVFHYESPDHGQHQLALSHGQFVVFAQFSREDLNNAQPTQLSLTVMVATQAMELPPMTADDDPWSLSPVLSAEPQYTDASFLNGRHAAALEGYRLRYRDAEVEWCDRPASLYDGFYGGTILLDLALDWRAGGYDLQAEGLDEFQRRFRIAARLPAFQIILRGADGARDDPRPERWLAEHFDPAVLAARWKHCGAPDDGWYDLEATFNGQ